MALLALGAALVIPAAALLAWRHAGPRGLVRLIAALSALFVASGLFLATAAGGNRLVRSYGYARVAPPILLAVGLELIVPTMLTAAVVAGLARRCSTIVTYGAAAVTCLLGVLLGGLAAYIVLLKLG